MINKLKPFKNTIIIILCSIGFTIHIYSITEQFLKFEIETEVETNFAESTLIVPDLSLCKCLI